MEEKTWTQRMFANPVFTHIGLLVLALIVGIIYIRWSKPSGPTYVSVPGATQFVPVPQKVVSVKTVRVPYPVKEVVLVPSGVVSERLKWPEIGKDNILTVGEVPSYRGKTNVVAVADFKDNSIGAHLVMRQEPMPFLGFEREWRGGLWYGIVGRDKIVGEVEFLPMRIGPVYPSIKGTAGMESGGSVNGQLLLGVRF